MRPEEPMIRALDDDKLRSGDAVAEHQCVTHRRGAVVRTGDDECWHSFKRARLSKAIASLSTRVQWT
jgi:hypothetical protein